MPDYFVVAARAELEQPVIDKSCRATSEEAAAHDITTEDQSLVA
jgi:hypothetical protein